MIVELDGHQPDIHPAAWIAPTATVIGQVTLGAASSLWYTTVVRGDGDAITIGARSNIQDGTVIHADPETPVRIGDDVSIGHRAVLHGCMIGDRVLVGMGSIIMNRATVGDDCLIAAGSLIVEGAEIPSGSLVMGSPATVRRTLTDDEHSAVQLNADAYVDLASRHESSVGDCPV